MSVGKQTGKASISFTDPVYIQSAASVVGSKEGNGPLKEYFDMICEDSMFGEKTWESAESTMQKEAATLAIGKAGLTPRDIRMVFAGDLLAQTIASSFGIAEMGIPFYGLYGACSTMGNPFLSERSLYLQAMGHISFVPLPVTLQLQKKNFVFHLVMVPSARSLPPGPLPEAVPA